MNKYVIAAIVLTIFQALLAVGGCYAYVRAIKGFRVIAEASDVSRVWRAWCFHLMWILLGASALLVCSFLNLSFTGGWRVVLYSSLAILFFATLQAFVRKGRLARSLEEGGKVLAEEGQGMVLVRALKPNRVRGTADDGTQLMFSDADLVGFKATKGFARMINLAVARSYTKGAMVPVFSFVNEHGSSYVLYSDDDVVPA